MDVNSVQQVKKVSLVWLMIILAVSVLLVNCSKKRVIEKKQIILISIDTLRDDHLTSSGYFRDTSPNLYKLIKDSTYYPNAYPNGCWTMPSHMSLLTGTLPSRHGINKDWASIHNKKYPKLNESLKTIAEILKSLDIKTIKFAKLPPDLGFARGFEIDSRVDPFFDNNKFNRLLGKLENHKEKDFFLFIHTWMVHAPYSNSYYLKKGKINKKKREYINNFRRLKKKTKDLRNDFRRFLKRNKLYNANDCMALYDGGIRYVDHYIGKIMDKTKQLDIYDNVMFIVVSDHGEHFNEHYSNKFYGCHGRDFYEEFIKVPVIIKYPYSSKSKRVDHTISLIDVFPTILDYYQIKIPSFVQGESLLTHGSQKERDRKAIISEAISLSGLERKMIRVGNLKYIITMKNPAKAERVNWKEITERRLFDLKTDSLEKNNLYNDFKFRRVCIEMEKILIRTIKNSAKTNLRIRETRVSEETIKQMEAMGYL